MRLTECENCKIDRAIRRLRAEGKNLAEIAAHPRVRLSRRQVRRRLQRMRESYEAMTMRDDRQ